MNLDERWPLRCNRETQQWAEDVWIGVDRFQSRPMTGLLAMPNARQWIRFTSWQFNVRDHNDHGT